LQGVKVSLNQDSIKRVKEQFTNLLQELQKQADKSPLKVGLEDLSKLKQDLKNAEQIMQDASKKLKLFNKSDLDKQGKELYKTFDEIKKKYQDMQLGEITFPGINKDAQENIQSFVMQLKEADGLVKQLKFEMVNVSGSNGQLDKFFVLDNVKEIDKTTEIYEKQAQEIQRINAKIVQDHEKMVQDELIRIQKMGQFKTNIDTGLFDKSDDEVKKYLQSLYGLDSKVISIKKTVDSANNSIIKATINTKNNKNEIEQEKIILDKTTASMYKNEEALKANTSRMVGFKDKLAIAIKSLITWQIGTEAVYGTMRKLKEGIQLVNDINKSQTNIQMITGMDSSTIKGLTKDYGDLATQLHSTTQEVMKGAEEFLRAGHSIEETRNLLKASTIGAAISGQDNQAVAEQLIAISNGFQLNTENATEMMNVIDKLSVADNNSATSFKEISEAMQHTASSAKNVNVSLTDLVSYISTVSSVSRRSASTIGESFKTIFARYEDVKGGKYFDPDNEPLSNVERDLNKIGIAIRKDKDTFKDFNVVLQELSNKWQTLSDVDKSTVTKALAGWEIFVLAPYGRNTILQLREPRNLGCGNNLLLLTVKP
jgi:TP901 family phage tail tape measure protein